MAHADYDCCAICDGKMSYQGLVGASTKKDICGNCTANLAEEGVIVHNVDEFLEWVKETNKKKVVKVLTSVGFAPCYYDNNVDDVIKEEIGKQKLKSIDDIRD